MTYKEGDRISGTIHKNGEPVAKVNSREISKAMNFTSLTEQAFAFDIIFPEDKAPPLQVNDRCQLVTDDGEIALDVVNVAPLPSGLGMAIFVFKQPYSDD
jgi:hypothetical protein